MNTLTNLDIDIIDTGGVINVLLDNLAQAYRIVPVSNPLTMTGDLTIAPSGTPTKGMVCNFLFDSSMILSGFNFSLFGYAVTTTQALTTWNATCYYNGSAWEVYFTQNASTTAYINGNQIIDGTIPLDKLVNLTADHIIIGDTGNVPTDVPMTGDVHVAYDGGTVSAVTTIQPAVVTLAKIANLADDHIILGNASNRPTAVVMSGDVLMDNAGVTTIQPGVVTPSMLSFSASVLQMASVTLSSAQILALNTTPIQIVASPGVGNRIIVVTGSIDYTFVTTAYATHTAVGFTTETATVAQVAIDVLAATLSKEARLTNQQTVGASDTQVISNKALMVNAPGGNPTTGDGTAVITVWYVII